MSSPSVSRLATSPALQRSHIQLNMHASECHGHTLHESLTRGHTLRRLTFVRRVQSFLTCGYLRTAGYLDTALQLCRVTTLARLCRKAKYSRAA
jgi:hypothetical protein